MAERKTSMEGGTESGNRHAIIVRREIMFGNIRIRCPNDFTEHEVPATATEFICPVDKTKLLISSM